ncbi:BON domain-containing protein [Bosea sp. ASV33]|uniref:BON domain-containing protein n=1 Tax=Bosea sp. ASV33 TaxID=2795106 RepID=UPI0018EDDA16|nr:BON domain-containing protein [Bosea sp. ASV33]
MTDKTLKQTVLDELAWEPSVNAAHIGVTARDGVVTLSGHVETYAEKWGAERSVERLAGVKAVAEELEVRSHYYTGHGDDDIAKRALNVLDWDVAIPHDKVRVKIENGWVTLSGELFWQYQRAAAEADVRKLPGVTGVTNMITIDPSIQASDVHAKIKTAFARNAMIDAEDITVVTDGGKVTLSGVVDSFYERDLAARTAWSAPGVTQVEDNLLIA